MAPSLGILLINTTYHTLHSPLSSAMASKGRPPIQRQGSVSVEPKTISKEQYALMRAAIEMHTNIRKEKTGNSSATAMTKATGESAESKEAGGKSGGGAKLPM